MNVDRTVQAEFRFGTPFTVKHTLNGQTAMDSRSATSGRTEIEAATVWKGITVTHQGVPLTNFSSSSANVPDWSQTLPPPIPKMTSAVEGAEMVFTWPAQARCELTVSPEGSFHSRAHGQWCVPRAAVFPPAIHAVSAGSRTNSGNEHAARRVRPITSGTPICNPRRPLGGMLRGRSGSFPSGSVWIWAW